MAPEGQTRIATLSRSNLRRDSHNILRRAGIEPWEHCYQTPQRSYETEWSQRFPAHVVAVWLGYSEALPRRFYLK